MNRPCWFDLSTSDLEAAKALYGDLFGWNFMDFGPSVGHYTIAQNAAGRAAAAIAPKMPGQEQMPTVWTVYWGTSDIHASLARISRHGGSIMVPPMHIPDTGHMAIAVDPDGAVFGLWQAGPFPGAQVENEPGAMCWSEVNSRNARANADFYAAVFDLEARSMDMQGVVYFTLHQDGGDPVCGVLQMDEQWEGIPPNWMPYFAVADLEAANATFTRHGGTMVTGPIPSPYGRIMVVKDKQGAYLSYMAS